MALMPKEVPDTKTDNRNGATMLDWMRIVVPVVLAILLPGVGFIASQTIENSKAVAIVRETAITLEDAVKLIQAHSEKGPHRQAMTRSEVTAAIIRAVTQVEKSTQGAIEALEKSQAIRDEALNKRLDRLEESLRK